MCVRHKICSSCFCELEPDLSLSSFLMCWTLGDLGDVVPAEHRQGGCFISAFKALLFVFSGLYYKLSTSCRGRVKPPERPSMWLSWLLFSNIWFHLLFVCQYLKAYLKRAEVTGLTGVWARNMCICKNIKKGFVYLVKLYMCTKGKVFNHMTQQCYWLYIGHK